MVELCPAPGFPFRAPRPRAVTGFSRSRPLRRRRPQLGNPQTTRGSVGVDQAHTVLVHTDLERVPSNAPVLLVLREYGAVSDGGEGMGMSDSRDYGFFIGAA